MKIKKLLFLSLFFIIGLLLFMPNKVNAIVTLGREITIDGASLVPHLGQTPGILPDTECYEVVEQKWTLENFEDFTIFEEGKTYMFTAKLKPKEGYEFSANTYYNFLNMEWIEERGGYLYDDGTVDFQGICTAVKTHKLTITSDEGITENPRVSGSIPLQATKQ